MSALRPYQLRAVELVAAAFTRTRRVVLVLPTGAGKTHTAAELIARAYRKGKRVLFIVHLREIVNDTARRLRALGIPCGVIMADEPETDAPVQVVSVQTAAARSLVLAADFLIWDECQHVVADTWRAIAEQHPAAWHLGLSATPVRGDGQGLRGAFDEMVIGSTIAELTRAGVLAPCRVVGPAKRQGQLAATPFDAWKRHANRRPTVAFCESVNASRELVAQLAAEGVAAAHLDGSTSKRRRRAILEDFDAGRLDVVSNVGILTEGWDSSRPEVILLGRGCDSPAAFLQIIGRGLRTGNNPGKVCTLIDLCGAVHEHGMPDAPRAWTLDGLRKPPPANDDAIRQCAECGAVYEARKYPDACPSGHEPPAREAREVKPAPLSLINSTHSREELQAELDHLSRLSRERGWKPNAVGVRFKEKFGFWPSRMHESRESRAMGPAPVATKGAA